MDGNHYSFQMLTRKKFLPIYFKCSQINFIFDNPFCESRVALYGQTDGRTATANLIISFRRFAKPIIQFKFPYFVQRSKVTTSYALCQSVLLENDETVVVYC